MTPAALVRFQAPGDRTVTLIPGDIIGRSDRAALPLDDGRVSEAHAMVSLRGDALRLLSLRGLFAIRGRAVRELDLRVGQEITLAEGVVLHVLELVLPTSVLGIESPSLGRRILQGACSLGPGPVLKAGYDPGSTVRIWSVGTEWRVEQDGAVHPLRVGTSISLGAESVHAVLVDLSEAVRHTTRDGGLRPPLRIEARYDTVHIHHDPHPPLVLGGLAARLISELVAVGGPVTWSAVARELWRNVPDENALRRKWDVLGVRTRAKLREAGIRTDLVRPSGTGQLELLLYPDDTVVDLT